MDGAAASLLMLSAVMAALLVGVASEQRVCYFGPPPDPDPDHPEDWMKQLVMQEIRKRCPGRRQPATAECSIPLGMEDRTIPDSQITASSSDSCCPTSDARLNSNNAWKPLPSDSDNPWIEVDLIHPTVVSGITTQGVYVDPNPNFVSEFKVSYNLSLSVREYVLDGEGNVKDFQGNTDASTPVTNLFDASVLATVVRVEPKRWIFSPSLRIELIGCRFE